MVRLITHEQVKSLVDMSDAIECMERARLQDFLRAWVTRVETLPEAARVRWALDVDPQETR